jgi:hypothetical protein
MAGNSSGAGPSSGPGPLRAAENALFEMHFRELAESTARYLLDHGLHPRRPITGDDIREHFLHAITKKQTWVSFRNAAKRVYPELHRSTAYYKSKKRDSPARSAGKDKEPTKWLPLAVQDRAHSLLFDKRDHHRKLRAQLAGTDANSPEELVRVFVPRLIDEVSRDPIAMLDLGLRAGQAVETKQGDHVFGFDRYRFEPTEALVREMPSTPPVAPLIPNHLAERCVDFVRLADAKLQANIGEDRLILLGRCLAAMVEGLALARRRGELSAEADQLLVAAATAAVMAFIPPAVSG